MYTLELLDLQQGVLSVVDVAVCDAIFDRGLGDTRPAVRVPLARVCNHQAIRQQLAPSMNRKQQRVACVVLTLCARGGFAGEANALRLSGAGVDLLFAIHVDARDHHHVVHDAREDQEEPEPLWGAGVSVKSCVERPAQER